MIEEQLTKIRAKFQILDVNGDDSIALDEWMTFMRDLGIDFDEDAFPQEFNSMDANEDGRLDFDEMLPMLARRMTMGTAYQAAGLVDAVNVGWQWLLCCSLLFNILTA